jgi:hypothetical protein
MRDLTIDFEHAVDAQDVAKAIYDSLFEQDIREFARAVVLHLGEYNNHAMNEFVAGVSDAMSECEADVETT